MTQKLSVLVIGGGIAGMSAAIALREEGAEVHLIDRDPGRSMGLTITGPTLRVMQRLGILDRVLVEGYTADDLLACDADGHLIARIETGGTALSGLPGAGGIMRPTLHRILSERLLALGPQISLGRIVTQIAPGRPKRVTFDDGSTGTYDMVIGADGIFSATRALLFPDAPAPRYVGQVCWRLMTERHPAIDRRTYFLGGPCKVGMNPVSRSEMYMFLLEPMQAFERCPDGMEHVRLANLMAPFGGPIADLRGMLTPSSNIVARPLETIFLDSPWHRDGTILIGDAAHATTPQLASGAGMAMEDGVVLAESLAEAKDIDAALDAFMARRHPRCALVVDSSLKLGRMERDVTAPINQVRVVEAALAELNRPY